MGQHGKPKSKLAAQVKRLKKRNQPYLGWTTQTVCMWVEGPAPPHLHLGHYILQVIDPSLLTFPKPKSQLLSLLLSSLNTRSSHLSPFLPKKKNLFSSPKSTPISPPEKTSSLPSFRNFLFLAKRFSLDRGASPFLGFRQIISL